MDYVDLSRRFSLIDPTQPFSAEAWEGLRRGYFSGLGWEDLLEYARVVVLAEAAAGKSAEFRARVADLRGKGQAAFYVTVESLSSYGLDASLGRDDAALLGDWHRGGAPAWFFLDSVDEARLNHKSVEQALNRFARDLGQSYDRARILLSCRGSVWTGEADLALVRRTLPVSPPPPEPSDDEDPDKALLEVPDKIEIHPPKVRDSQGVTVVALTKLSNVQRKALLSALKVPDIENLETALFAHGLQQLAERPGDLMMLARYWQKYLKFGSLTEMLDLGISERLAERGDARRTLSAMTDDQLRAGAERLAAALVLGRSMNLRLPEHLPELDGAIDPRQVLSDLPAAEIERLLDRGLFVPATFGLVRFYHRSAQEYLAACWFRRMGTRLTDPDLNRIFLADALGIETIPPSLRATAAWLAIWRPALRQHILEREPLVLLENGDPAALSLEEKQRLLTTYAERDAKGDIAYSRIDHQSLWMFAEEALAPAINSAVSVNDREDFRFEMLRLIEEGEISGCVDFAREAASAATTRAYHRIVATRVLRRLNDDDGLAAVAADVVENAEQLGADLAPSLVSELFPKHLSVADLLSVIARAKPGREFQTDGFKEYLVLLFEACPGITERKELIAGLTELIFEPPLDDWPRLSKRHRRLADGLAPVARQAIVDSDQDDYGAPLVRLLMALERAGWANSEDGPPPLWELVAARPALRQALFWGDVVQAISEAPPRKPLRSWRRAWVGNQDLWSLSEDDASWLEAGLKRNDADERLVALTALIELARLRPEQDEALDQLSLLVKDDPTLSDYLSEARKPYVESEQVRQLREENAHYSKLSSERQARENQAWINLRDRLKADPSSLCDPEKLKEWPGPVGLYDLTSWLARRNKKGRSEGARQWRQLAGPFGEEVAQAYRKGMALIWRLTPAERPEISETCRTVKRTIMLSDDGLRLEASEDADWARNLSSAEAERAALHACLDDQGTSQWLDGLLEHHGDVVTAPIIAEMTREWDEGGQWRPLLEQAAHGLPIPPALRDALLAMIRRSGGASPATIDIAAKLTGRLDLSDWERSEMYQLFDEHLVRSRNEDLWNSLANCLAILFLLDQEAAAGQLLEVLKTERRRRHKSRAFDLLKQLFGRHHGIVRGISELMPATLSRIILEAYRERNRLRSAKFSDTDENMGDEVRDRFDDAGGLALSALLAMKGEDAHRQMLWLSQQSEVGTSALRLRELAYEMAEQNSERPAWCASALKAFEDKSLAPIATGGDLMSVALEQIDAVIESFRTGDMSARSVVASARDEAAVQEWLGETLNLRSEGRFHVSREAQVAEDNRPDLLVSSTSSTDQLAIEVKHGDKGWSLSELRKALTVQLAQQYLLPLNRRHGVLVISHHRETQFWRDKAKRRRMTFSELITNLEELATTITFNATGPVTVVVRGIDAASNGGRM